MADRGTYVLTTIRDFPGKDASKLMEFRKLARTDANILRDLEKAGLIEYRKGWYITSKGDIALIQSEEVKSDST